MSIWLEEMKNSLTYVNPKKEKIQYIQILFFLENINYDCNYNAKNELKNQRVARIHSFIFKIWKLNQII